MQKQLLLGAEAIAQGAIDGGMSGIYAYPGTPSTEITEYVQENKFAIEKKIHREWSANEKTSYESALGMSYAGKRTMVCMKHVGLNVAADAFVNSAITGINGGMVVTVADDPSMHSSQNEQDSRFYSKFALIPSLEPSCQQEAYDMARNGFAISEEAEVPVLLRITTRISHSRAGVEVSQPLPENELNLPKDPHQFILLPGIARKRYKGLIAAQDKFVEMSENSPYNKYVDGDDRSLGIICCGITYNYLMENYPETCPYPHIKIGQYPLPEKMIKKLENECDEILILEEGMPVVEEQLSDYFEKGIRIHGRLNGALPRDGELNADIVAAGLQREKTPVMETPEWIVGRPPALCKGCGHQDMYQTMNDVLAEYGKGHVFSDIGCYTLGALPPYESINSCVDMGASITMAKGAADAGLFPAVAVIGDSTFTHSGMTGLLDCVNEKTNVVIIISDNESTSMTGGQQSAAEGKIETICEGIGVDPKHIRVIVPVKKNHEEMRQMLIEEIAYDGVSVIIPRRDCIQRATRLKRAAKKK